MNESKIRAGFLYFFFFFQGVFLTGMILLAIFDNKIVPVMKEKDTEIEFLLNEVNRIKHRGHNHSENDTRRRINNHTISI